MLTNHIILCTCDRWPEPSADLNLAIEALHLIDQDVVTCPWQSTNPRHAGALIVPLAAWDYADDPSGFRDWLDRCARAGMRFGNAPNLMKWNMDKRYLCDLAEQGVRVPETIPVLSANEVHEKLLEKGWSHGVLKPAIGQSGNGVCIVYSGEKIEEFVRPRILQPWLPQICNGELSMVFLNSSFSHAVLRLPPQGEWRANSQYGVQINYSDAPNTAIEAGLACLAMLPEKPLYARIDGLIVDKHFLLTELELIEPALFLDIVPDAAGRFAAAVQTRMS